MRELLDRVESEDFALLVVWQPILRGDDAAAARDIAGEETDARARHFWDARLLAGKAWERRLGIEGTAWDVYLLHGRRARWDGGPPPPPDFWMQQLSSARELAPRLDVGRLVKEAEALLARAPAEGEAGPR